MHLPRLARVLACPLVFAGCGVARGPGVADAGVQDAPSEPPDLGTPACEGLRCFQIDCGKGQSTTISGRVTAPNGKDPIYDAIVYVPKDIPEFPPMVQCEVCSEPIGGPPIVGTPTKIDGSFVLANVPATHHVPVIVQKGRFRRIQYLDIKQCADNPMTAEQARLPKNQKEGDLPHIAVGVGDFDQIECVLHAIGIDASEFTWPGGNGAVHLYNNSDLLPKANTLGDLLQDAARMARYNMLFIGCAIPTFAGLPNKAKVKANLFNYVNTGGRLYATDYSYDYLEQVPQFAPYIYFDGGGDMTLPQPSGAAQGIWDGAPIAGTVTDPTLITWLKALGKTQKGEFQIQSSYALALATAKDQKAFPSTTWVRGIVKGVDRPHSVTFDYNQCGKVLWSSYHTREPGGSSGIFPNYCLSNPKNPDSMIAQEKILEFLILQISGCVNMIG
ncbi:MAG: hypothetical protein EXR72_23000 [Myxococcales bacterium]|nr:hypothetical protein [Myxococcales bacterium]